MILAFDIGGTKIAAALVDDGQIIEYRVQSSVLFSDFESLIPALIGLSEDWVDEIKAVHVATAGLVSTDEVHFFTVKPGLRRPLHSELTAAFGKPVQILNDASAAAWGEFVSGEYAEDDSLVYLAVSTGIGGGIVAGGRLVTGTTGLAGHLGHTSVNSVASVRCVCGRDNCAEAVASGTAIARRASEIVDRSITAEKAIALSASDASVAAIVDDAARAVAEVLTNAKAVTDTHTVILGGGVGLNDEFRRRVKIALAESPDIYHFTLKRPALVKNAELVGAATYEAEQ